MERASDFYGTAHKNAQSTSAINIHICCWLLCIPIREMSSPLQMYTQLVIGAVEEPFPFPDGQASCQSSMRLSSLEIQLKQVLENNLGLFFLCSSHMDNTESSVD